MQKKTFSSSKKRQLQVFSQMMQMKFKPKSNTATTSIVQKNKKIISKLQKNNEGIIQYSKSTLSHMTNRDKKLKYLNSLSPQYFLIGNQNQIDMICIIGITHSFVDTDYCWSLSVAGPISNLAVQPRKCLIGIVSDNKLYFYKYNLKRSKETPQLIKQFDIKPDVKFIQFPKDTLFGLFYEKQFELYNVQQHKKIMKKCGKAYNEPTNFTLFSVPQTVQNSLKLFFIQQKQDDKTFGLWFIKINIENIIIDLEKPQKVYDIKRTLRKMLVVQNFSKDIIFMNIGAEILAAKNGYILDSANVNIQSGNAKLKYICNQRLIHISDKKVEIYKMNIISNVVPNKIQVIPIDALEITDKPLQAQYFGIIPILNDNFAVFYQNLSQFNIYTKGQATYWFMMTQSIPLQQKIQRTFDCQGQISSLNPEILEQKCDMARKMGLNQKQLYLQIWNRSNKNSIQDYQFLLATRNYKTIHSQIEKKLKKQSMSYRELLKIEESCLDILRLGVYGSKCTQQNIQEYLASHCFIKKLKLFKDIELYRKIVKKSTIKPMGFVQEDQNNKLLINIQQYYEHKQFDIKNYLVQKISQFCLYEKESRATQIRLMLRNFKFVYRIIYKQVLEEIIKNCKGKLISLLKTIPQILPYHSYKTQDQLEQNQELNLYEGIWNEIKQDEWKKNLFVQNLSTIDNKEVVAEFIKSIWYKRYWLTAHQLINLSKEKIIDINKQNNSQKIFYFFISKVFDLVLDQSVQFQIIYFLEQNYSRIPEHLRGKIFLHFNLHKFYVSNHAIAKLPPKKLDQFLNLNDAQLFEYFFVQQKYTKNCILKNIKKIYQEICQQGDGLNLFNEGLLAYFKSDLSQISDLKYLLNRMNNQKTQFHQANLSIYEVLVRAMEYKLKLGSDEDIPIDQVLIYIEKIPISQDNEVMAELHVVQKINQQAQRFKKMRLNMTLKEIIDNCQDVISRIVEYEFQINEIRKIQDSETLKAITYKILAEVQIVKQKLYGEQYANLPFFIYLTKILEDISQIHLANILLEDQFLRKHFPIDETIKQNLVLYMYKWAFSKNCHFIPNQAYIKQLITLLPADNQNRKFIQSQTEFAIALSTKEEPLQYPISIDSPYPRIAELSQILKFLPVEHILNIDIESIFTAMSTMQAITLKDVVEDDSFINLKATQKITIHQVYSVFVLRLIEQNYLNHAVILLKRLLQLQISNKRYNMIFFILLIQKLSIQLNDQCKNVMIKTISYCYDQPEVLFEFIEYYFHSKQTALQKGRKLRQFFQQLLKNRINFNKSNILFNRQSQQALSNSAVQTNSKRLIESICSHLRQTKPDYQTVEYELLFSILCNQPLLAAKFIQMNEYKLNYKALRSYFSFIIQQAVFDETQVMEFCKKIFSMILESNIKEKDISRFIINSDHFHFNLNELKQIGIVQQIDKQLQKTLKSFQKKKKSLGIQMNKKKSSSNADLKEPEHQIHIHLKHPQSLSSKQPSQYPFSDSDNQAEQAAFTPNKPFVRRKFKHEVKDFDQKSERNKIMKRKNSFFGDRSGDISSQKNRSRNESNDQETQQNPTQLKSISLKVPDVKATKIYVKRTLTSEKNINKKNFSTILQKQESELQSKINKLQKKQSAIIKQNALQQIKVAKQESQYSIHQVSQIKQDDAGQRIKDLTVRNFQKNEGSKIDFEILSKQQDHQDFNNHLKEAIIKIFEDKQLNNNNKITIIRLISQKYPKCSVNNIFLAIYDNIQKTEQKYNLGLPIDRLLPAEGIFIDSKLLDQLFKIILPRIVQIATDQTIYKLSKLISLGFRKNIYEADISFEYIRKMIDQFAIGHSEVQLNMRLQIVRSLISKLSIMSLKQRAVRLVDGIIANPGLQQKIIQNVVQSVKRRGDPFAAQEIRKNMQK